MRETKSFNDDLIDLEELAGRTKKKQDDVDIVTAVAQQSNFSSRGDNKKKERKRSPYVIQKNIKMRIGMPELLAGITSRIRSDSDQETLERAILALIEKEKLNDIKVKYNELMAS